METSEKLLIRSLEMFMRYGIKSVSMDDIASEMGMSKKTLYQYVKDKRDLVNQSVNYHFTQDREACSRVLGHSSNAIEQMLDIASHVIQMMRQMNPSTIYDLRKYYPEGWKKFEEHRKVFIVSCIRDNIQNGKENGLYRPELSEDVIAKIYITLIDASVNPTSELAELQNYSEIIRQVIDYHLHAITTHEGREYLYKHIEALNL
ncbi:MAG: TetR/AcrR family transcriptional regulator [Flavobacteriales bacterium]|nr:TetR/AcrR family transcriptional regulator [Bacteroidota bacterium]MCB9241178.1 TetR/AcrR family transcriptional regulator [Flavobacteriales bacterium]